MLERSSPSTLTWAMPPSTEFMAQERNCVSLFNVESSAYEHSDVRAGNRIAFPAGIEQSLTAGLPVIPARNQTGPFWPCAQFAPVLSLIGLMLEGICANHCHHFDDHSPYVEPYGLEFIENTPGFMLSATAWGITVTMQSSNTNANRING